MNNNNNRVTDEYYDNRTYDMLVNRMSNEEREHIQQPKYVDIYGSIENFIFTRWSSIVNSLPPSLYNQYSSYDTSIERNDWFQRYLNYPTKDISEMPELL